VLRGMASGVGLSFAAWPAGWFSPSRHGQWGGSLLRGVASGVGLLWAAVVVLQI
jgi:hypothetical protein